jgi:glycerol uptake facilitator-like aquaporin
MLDNPMQSELNLIAVKTLIVFGKLIPNRYLNPNLTINLVGGITGKRSKTVPYTLFQKVGILFSLKNLQK